MDFVVGGLPLFPGILPVVMRDSWIDLKKDYQNRICGLSRRCMFLGNSRRVVETRCFRLDCLLVHFEYLPSFVKLSRLYHEGLSETTKPRCYEAAFDS